MRLNCIISTVTVELHCSNLIITVANPASFAGSMCK